MSPASAAHPLRLGRLAGLGALLLGLALAAQTWAKALDEGGVEFDGLVINQMQTKIGQDFYDHFMQVWEPPPRVGAYEVTLGETVSPQWGNLIWVKVNDVVVFQQLVSSRSADLAELGGLAANVAADFLIKSMLKEKDSGDGDLAPSGL